MQEPQEIWVQSPGWEDPLEEGMTFLSSILAWRIPWTEEPGRLQSIGHRVRHDWSDLAQHIYIHKWKYESVSQTRILQWVAIPFSHGSSWPRDQTQVSCISSELFMSGYVYIHTHLYFLPPYLFWPWGFLTSLEPISPPVSMYLGCCNKVSQTGWLIQQKCIVTFLETRDMKSRCLLARLFPSESCEEKICSRPPPWLVHRSVHAFMVLSPCASLSPNFPLL